jgi:hypothetical protein
LGLILQELLPPWAGLDPALLLQITNGPSPFITTN